MPLSAGTCLGNYEILSALGAGGMGEVYRARDSKLRRDVALKILPASFTNDPERVARFSREAHVLASLNHPHIGQIYGLDDANGTQFLVLELVDGESLDKRIARGAIPVDDALPIAKQIAEALEAAHEKGIVHRDLKPANIALTKSGEVKVLDFGLAKAVDSISEPTTLTNSPTETLPAMRTGIGTIVGTAAYMSPEQARGEAADRRSDIWSFACVLYEMLTAHRAFGDKSSADALARVLMNDVDWTTLPPATPAVVRSLLRQCLAKDRRQRLDSAVAARLAIDEAIGRAAALPVRRRMQPASSTVIFAATGVVVAILIWFATRSASPAAVVASRFAIEPPTSQPLNMASNDGDLALSPDGRYLVYRGGGSGTSGSPLFVRALDQLDARLLYAGGAYGPFFSPDGRWVGFFEGGELKRVPIAGGPAVTICRVNGGLLGASWADNGMILFATDDPDTGLWRVSASGGEPTAITTPDAESRRVDRFPSALPGSRWALVTLATAGRAENPEIAAVNLQSGQRKTLVRGGTQAEYVGTAEGGQAGFLVYAMAGDLRAVRFDPARLEAVADPVAVEEHVLTKSSGAANYAVSQTGTLVYVLAGTGGTIANRSLVWVDRKGGEQPINAPVRAYGSSARLSPDGTRVAVLITEGQDVNLWIWNLARETLRRVTLGTVSMGRSSTRSVGPVWTPDSRRLLFSSDRDGALNLYGQAADGTGIVDRITTNPNRQWVTAVTPDGSHAIGWQITSGTQSDIIAYSLKGPSNIEPLVQTASFPELSPDGRYLAYQSNESGKFEIYVRPYPGVNNARWQISTNGGTRVAWARNGRELFYFDGSNAFTVVPVQPSGSTFVVGRPETLFDTTPYYTQNPSRTYDVSLDSQRFLWAKNVTGRPATTTTGMLVVEHWLEASKSHPLTR